MCFMWGVRRSGRRTARSACSSWTADGTERSRVPVKVGRASVNSIQVIEGLHEGDTVDAFRHVALGQYRSHPASGLENKISEDRGNDMTEAANH